MGANSLLYRPALASLFDPQSIYIIADTQLPPHLQALQSRSSVQLCLFDSQQSDSLAIFPSVSGQRLDLALVCVPPNWLKLVLNRLAALQPRTVVVLRHAVASDNAQAESDYCHAWGLHNDCLVVGPHSLGIQRPHNNLNLSLDAYQAPAGQLAVVVQSTSLMAAIMDWAKDIGLGFSAVLSIGPESSLDVSDVLDFLAMDNRTSSIALYLDYPLSARRFSSALHAAASVKPVLVLKSQEKQNDNASNAVFDALLRRAGAVRVPQFIQLFSAIKVMAHQRRPRGRRLAVLSNGYAQARLALDAIQANENVQLAHFTQTTQQNLQQQDTSLGVVNNPVITYTSLTANYLQSLLQSIAADTGVDGIVLLIAPDIYSNLEAAIEGLTDVIPAISKPVITCLLGDASMRTQRKQLDKVGAPAFRTPESAVEGFALLAAYHDSQVLAQQSLPPEPLSWPPQRKKAQTILQEVLVQGKETLTPEQCQQLMSCFYVPLALDDKQENSFGLAVQMRNDTRFGPYLSLGAGRKHEWFAFASHAVDLPPLNHYLARQMVQRSAVWQPMLKNWNDDALALIYELLERLSDLICELPAIKSMSIDPLFVGQRLLYTSQLDIQLYPHAEIQSEHDYSHLAIHPYPRHLVQERQFKTGEFWLLRPIRPEDAELLQEFIRDLSEESRYMRFVSLLKELTPRMLARYTSIDYDRERALVASITLPNPENRGYPRECIIGFAHYLRNADGVGAEYALVIGDQWQRQGLGLHLMQALINEAKEQGLSYIDGYVLVSNRAMLGLMRHLGFQVDQDANDPTMRRVWLDLS